MARGRNFRANIIRSGRKTFWFDGVWTRTSSGTGVSTVVTSLNAAALALRPFTVVRTRGVIRIGSDQIIAIETQLAAFGHIIVSDQAVAVGVTAVPTPLTESGSDWFVYQPMAGEFVEMAQSIQQIGGELQSIDSKAMRKVEEGQDIIGVVENDSTSDGVVISVFTRILIKLH